MSLLAPKGVLSKNGRLFRKNLWQGGKSNETRFHLVNWQKVRLPILSGGLGVKDPELMNIAMDAKIVWRLISPSSEWWKSLSLESTFIKADS